METGARLILLLVLYQCVLDNVRAHPSDAITLICPPRADMEPCGCYDSSNPLYIACTLGSINQEAVTNAFTLVRQVNNLSQSDWLNISRFELSSTHLPSLDLTPLSRSNIQVLNIPYNSELTSLILPTTSTNETELEPFRFGVGQLSSRSAFLNETFINELLRFVTSTSLELMYIQDYKYTEGSSSDFIPDVSRFVNLWAFNYYGNQVKVVEGGQFRANRRLKSISLADNEISSLGQDAFLLDGPVDDDLIDVFLWINMTANGLTDDHVDPRNGLSSIQRPVKLFLEKNKFEYISETNFKDFLLANTANEIYLKGNPIVCDSRMEWLRNEGVDGRVFGVPCVNDPGHGTYHFHHKLDLTKWGNEAHE